MSSSNSTAGLIAADVLAYLKSWDVLFPNPKEEEQASLFESPVAELNTQKLKLIRETLALVKNVEVLEG